MADIFLLMPEHADRLDALCDLVPEALSEGRIECGRRHFREALGVRYQV